MKSIILKFFGRFKKQPVLKKVRRYQFLLKEVPKQEFRISFSCLKSGYFSDSFEATGKLSKSMDANSISIINVFTNQPAKVVDFFIYKREIQLIVKDLSCIKPRFNNTTIFKIVYKTEGQKPIILASFALFLLQSRPQTIFIVGSPRSGTTAVGKAVQKILNKTVHGESHIAPYFKRLQAIAIRERGKSSAVKSKGTLMHELLPIELELEFHNMVKNIHTSFYGREFIIDKTPGLPMIEALPFLFRIYPNSKVIFCKRRGIENIQSRLRKFPKVSFRTHCRQWVNSMKGWTKIKKQLVSQTGHESWLCEIDQYELLHDSINEINKIASFLNTDKTQAKKAINFLKKNSPQRTSKDTSATSLEKTDWTDEQKIYFLSKSSAVMKAFNYSFDDQYFLKDKEQ